MLEIASVSKSFGALRAVDDVSLRIGSGEIVGLAGENGAGKTTLMRIVARELEAGAGSIHRPPGVELVHQHFMLVPGFSIAENLVLSRPGTQRFLSRRNLVRLAEELVASSGLRLEALDRPIDDLSVGERSRVELIKALSRKPELLILDEPTSVLTPVETDELFAVMRNLAARGTAIVFISHKLPEVLAVCTRVVVMRGGRIVADTAESSRTARGLAEEMVGRREAPARKPATPRASRPALVLDSISATGLREVSLEVGRGEIVAIAGVAGNGQPELAELLRGLAPASAGRIQIGGIEQNPASLLAHDRVGHIPEDRTRNGLIGEMSIAENIALRTRSWRRAEAEAAATRLISLYNIKARHASQPAGELSGGNQQKVILARELDRRPELIVAAEPTRGLDTAAASFVHAQLRTAADAGAGILLITSDLDEALSLGDALHVIYRGRLSERLSPEVAATRVAGLMAGVA